MGLVNSVEPDANFEAAVRETASQIIDCAPLSVRASKKIVDQVIKDSDQRDMTLCEALVEGCRTSEDFAEGRRAFQEKRRGYLSDDSGIQPYSQAPEGHSRASILLYRSLLCSVWQPHFPPLVMGSPLPTSTAASRSS